MGISNPVYKERDMPDLAKQKVKRAGKITKQVELEAVVIKPQDAKGKLPVFVYLASASGFDNFGEELAQSFKGIIIEPICHNGIWQPDSVAFFVQEFLKENKDADEKRVYLSGFSMGARGVWDVSRAYPHMFAALVPMSGYSCYLEAHKIAHIPTWAFHGKNDSIVPAVETVKMIRAMRQVNETGDIRVSLLEGHGHEGFHWIFQKDQLMDWLLEQRLP